MLGFKTAITSAPFSTEYCNGRCGKINKNIWGRRQQNYSFDFNDFVEVQWWVHFSARMITRGQSRACGAAQDNPFCSRTSRRLLWSALQDVLGRICSYHFTPVLCRIFSFEVTIVGHFSPPAGKYCRIFFFDAACALHIVPGSLLQSYGGSFASMLWRISLFHNNGSFTEKDLKVVNPHLSLPFFMSCAEE